MGLIMSLCAKLANILLRFFTGTMLCVYFTAYPVCAQKLPEIEAASAILIDAGSGKILYKKNSDKMLQPASLTKIMTAYVILEAIDQGMNGWYDKVGMSDYAYRIAKNSNLSNYPVVDRDQEFTLRELFESMAVFSSNSAAIMLAEHIYGSETEFVRIMNKKAETLGLENFFAYDCTGLSNGNIRIQLPYTEGGNRITALDTARLSYSLLRDFPGILDISNITDRTFLTRGKEKVRAVNYNWMLPGLRYGYRGLDGIKTGHTESAGYCFSATASRSGLRLIAVVLKAKSRYACFLQTKKLLDYGFDNYHIIEYIKAGYRTIIPVYGGKRKYLRVVTRRPLSGIDNKAQKASYNITTEIGDPHSSGKSELAAPLRKGQFVGTLKLEEEDSTDEYIYPDMKGIRVELYSDQDVSKTGWLRRFGGRIIKSLETLKKR